jgi:hypothetical protein
MSFYQYIDYLLKERKNLEDKVKYMSKAELVQLGRQLLATYRQSLKGFDEWFTNFYVMDKMDIDMLKDVVLNLMRIGFQLLEYDRYITWLWYEKEEAERRKMLEDKGNRTHIV